MQLLVKESIYIMTLILTFSNFFNPDGDEPAAILQIISL